LLIHLQGKVYQEVGRHFTFRSIL